MKCNKLPCQALLWYVKWMKMLAKWHNKQACKLTYVYGNFSSRELLGIVHNVIMYQNEIFYGIKLIYLLYIPAKSS